MPVCKRKVFDSDDYKRKGGFFSEDSLDWEGYHKAIADFVTSLGPDRVISVGATPGWYRWGGWSHEVWYWAEE